MIIDLDNNHRIRSTSDCWRLETEHINKGKVRWKALGYYTTFANAVRAAADREIRTHHAHGLGEAIEACHAICAKYETLLAMDVK